MPLDQPSPVRWEGGDLQVEDVWARVSCDVTHVGTKQYLTFVDCGLSRFAIWKEIPNEEKETVLKNLLQVFAERGPPAELLMDNARSFRAQDVMDLCRRWGVKPIFRGAYRPQGNGIVERNHRTIKRMSARTGRSIPESTYWYNITPREGQDRTTTPAARMREYEWRFPVPVPTTSEEGAGLPIGTRVFVKPHPCKCTSVWQEGRVTGKGNTLTVEIDGVPRHVADIRVVPGSNVSVPTEIEDHVDVPAEENTEHHVEAPAEESLQEEQPFQLFTRRANRHRRPPAWHRDFSMK